MSRLIKKEEGRIYSVDSYRAEKFEGDESPNKKGKNGLVELPLNGDLSSSYLGSRKEKDIKDLKGEELEERIATLEREAYEKGFEQGRKDGLALEQRQVEEKGKQLDELFGNLLGLKGQIYNETEGEMLKLSTLIAKKIIRAEVKTNSEIIGNVIKAASKFVVDKTSIRIRLNPEDLSEVRNILPELSDITKGGQFQVIEDNAIQKGGSVLETGFGQINASIEDQLWMLEEEIQRQFDSSQIESSRV